MRSMGEGLEKVDRMRVKAEKQSKNHNFEEFLMSRYLVYRLLSDIIGDEITMLHNIIYTYAV